MSTILKSNTKKGQHIICMGSRYEGYILSDVYERYSQAKQNAYDWCYDKYLNTPEHESFSICSHNSFVFTCSWLGKHEGFDALFVETCDNSYIVLLLDDEEKALL